jgi:hypothetical protein
MKNIITNIDLIIDLMDTFSQTMLEDGGNGETIENGHVEISSDDRATARVIYVLPSDGKYDQESGEFLGDWNKHILRMEIELPDGTATKSSVIESLRDFEMEYTGDDDNDYEEQFDELYPLIQQAFSEAADALESEDHEEFAAQVRRAISLEQDMGDCPDTKYVVEKWAPDWSGGQWDTNELEIFAKIIP